MTQVHELTAVELAHSYAARDLSPEVVVATLLGRVDALDRALNAVLISDATGAGHAARASARRYKEGRPLSALDGVPVLVKDNIDTESLRTTYGSALFRDNVPGRHAEVVRTLHDRGLIILAKTNLNEFAWGISGVNPHYGSVRNPHDPALIAGGSSSGSAAGVAAAYAPLALGTDTGGSVRIPAAYCGVTGFKPSYGLVPVGGTFPLARSLDHIGLLGRNVDDILALFGELADRSSPGGARSGLRLGVAGLDQLAVDMRARVQAVLIRWAERAQHSVVDVALPPPDEALDVFRKLQAVEALGNHRARGLFPSLAAEYGGDVRARLRAATAVSASEVSGAVDTRGEIRAFMTRLFDGVDLVVTPTVQVGPWRVDEPFDLDRDAEHRRQTMAFTVPWNLTGLPVCALPIPLASGLPASVQIAGPVGGDRLVLGAASDLEREVAAVHD
jgi:aspartyl-tRNA(Asn)/glutamyl-tRNA(Gln) amidotransferase subunit A